GIGRYLFKNVRLFQRFPYCSIDFGRFPPMFRLNAARSRNRTRVSLVSVSQSPQLFKARRFGAKRDSLFTLDSERRCRLEAQCLFPISAFPIRSSPRLRPLVTRSLPPSRNRRFLTFWRAATFSASPRPAPARPLPSSCPFSPCW